MNSISKMETDFNSISIIKQEYGDFNHIHRLPRITTLKINNKEVAKMGYSIACRDAGVACDHVSRGETEEEVLAAGLKHVKEAHGFTDEQLNDPKFLEESKKIIKKT